MKFPLFALAGSLVASAAGAAPILAPPAIGPDGSVWVGTARALYVAR